MSSFQTRGEGMKLILGAVVITVLVALAVWKDERDERRERQLAEASDTNR